jgi:hypothetical protein
MIKAPEFWQYADEALRAAAESKSDSEKQALMKLADLWSRAALRVEAPPIWNNNMRRPGN